MIRNALNFVFIQLNYGICSLPQSRENIAFKHLIAKESSADYQSTLFQDSRSKLFIFGINY
jgi:hypothetical protein